MKTFSDEALAALQRGDAIVSASVEIIPVALGGTIVLFNDEFDYQILDEIVDTSDPDSIVPPSTGFDSSGLAPFGHNGGTLDPIQPIATAWLPDTSLWLKKDITVTEAGTLTFSGRVENAALFFIDDVLVGSVNPTNVNSSNVSGLAFDVDAAVTTGAHTLKILVLDEAEIFSGDNTYFYISVRETFYGGGTAGTPIRLWGGYGDADLPSDEGTSTFNGIGDRGLIASSTGAIGGTAQNLTLALSGIEPAAIAVLNPDEVRDASVVVRRLIFDSAGKALLGAYVFCRGRLDELKTSEMVGGAAAIQLSVEGAARGLGRRGGRARSDADQRLVSSTDGFYRVVSAAPKKTLYWGGKTPSIGGSLTGGGGGTTSASTSISSVRSF